MKIIFLDIDGVLNNQSLLQAGGIHTIEPSMVAILKRVVDATGAEIVLSSTWRILAENRRMVQQALRQFGMRFIDTTPNMRGDRCDEIRDWLARHPSIESFAILDDDMYAGIDGHLCQTSFYVGLTDEIADKAIGILGLADVVTAA
jgi:hypothetical protein